jgi:hypothetical protein
MKRVVAVLTVLTLTTAVILVVTRSEVVGWIVAAEAFAVAVAALIYRADVRPNPKHRVK